MSTMTAPAPVRKMTAPAARDARREYAESTDTARGVLWALVLLSPFYVTVLVGILVLVLRG